MENIASHPGKVPVHLCPKDALAGLAIANRGSTSEHVRHRQIADLHVTEIQACGEAFRRTTVVVNRAMTELFVILMQREGSSTISFAGAASQILESGDLLINSARQRGVWTLGEGSSVTLIEVPSVLLQQAVGFAHEDRAVAIGRGSANAQLVTLFLDMLCSRGDALAPQTAGYLRDGLLKAVSAAIEPQMLSSSRGGPRVAIYHRARIERFFRQHLTDSALDVDMIAQGVQLSVSHIHRLYAGSERGGVMRRVWYERLAGSRNTLEAGGHWDNLSISEVGWRWGFQSAAHFSRSFKERFGMTPGDCRATAQSESG